MKKTVLIFGAISSLLLATLVAVTVWMLKQSNGNMENGEVIGYLSMLIAFAFIFMAVKSYRDRYLGGSISFKKAFMVGLWITLISSAVYTITWIVLYKTMYPEFMDVYAAHVLDGMKAKGKTVAEIQKAAAAMEQTKAIYDTWPGLIGFTLMEIMPVGLIVSLLSALILKRRPKANGQFVLEATA